MNKDEENIPREIVVLQKATAPEGYVPVPGAMVSVANNPGNTTVTDSAGKFTLGMDTQDSEADGKVTIIVTLPETLEKSAPIRHEIYPPVNSTEIRELFLSPAVQSITIGGVAQLYARATMKDGSRRTIDPSLVTWQVDNQSIAMVTPEGVLLGLNQGTAQVTISVANLRATGRFIIRAITGRVFSLKGTVTDGKGEPLSGVIIMILGREMKIISFIDDFPVTKKILTHLNLWHISCNERPSPGMSAPSEDERLRTKDPYTDYYFLDVALGRN